MKTLLEILFKKPIAVVSVLCCFFLVQTSFGQETIKISGTVISSVENSEVLPFINIIEKGTYNGTTTDINGNYQIERVNSNAVLQFSSLGFKTKEVKVEGRTTINVELDQDLAELDQIVVIGYGTQKKKDLTGSIASVKGEDFDTQAINSVTEMLRGRVAGFNTTIGTSAKGSSGFEIRGRTSLQASNSPLVVIDGIIYYGDIADINPNDIKNIDVLKDASAAAVYGSRAAAGVIIITTKEGKTGKPVISYNSTVGVATLGRSVRPRGPEGYLQQRQDVLIRQNADQDNGYYSNPSNLPSGVNIEDWRAFDNATNGSDAEVWLGRLGLSENEIANYLSGKTINWFDQVYRTAIRNDHNISLSGKSEKINYYASLGYVDNEGIVYGDEYNNFRSRMKIEADVTDYLTFGINAQFASRDQSALSANNFLVRYASPYGDKYEEDGTLKWYPNEDTSAPNPFLNSDSRIDNKVVNQNLLSNIYMNLKLPWGFDYRVNWTNRLAYSQDYTFFPSSLPNGLPAGKGNRIDGKAHFWTVDNILTWNKKFGDHKFDLTFLYNVEKQRNWESRMSNENFSPNENLGYSGLHVGTNPTIAVNDRVRTGDALMGRLNYSLLNRYLLTISLRRDGYSAFGAGNPRAYFPAAAIAWRLSEENFFNSNIISNLKLRLSYGVNGNREIGEYSALSRLNTTKYIYGNNTYTGVWTANLANKSLRWEKTTAYNAGVDFGLFNNRISGQVDAYYTSTDGLLLRRSLPEIIGYENVWANLGEVTNKGLEVTLNSLNIDNEKFKWNSSIIFSLNRNKIKHLYGDMEDVLDEEGNVIGERESDDRTNGWFIGQALDRIYDYEVLGVWQVGEEDEAAGYGMEPGDFRLRDVNEDGQLLPEDDKVFQGYTKPRYRVSLYNHFNLGENFELSFLFSANLDYLGGNNSHLNSDYRFSRANNYDYPYWTPENPINNWARLDSNVNPGFSYYVNRSFIKLQNVSLAYNLPSLLLEKLKFKRCQLFINTQNVFSVTKWDAWDPETNGPTPSLFSAGINLSL
jgi:TonB-linked SusC/RagA family outer membrane protein